MFAPFLFFIPILCTAQGWRGAYTSGFGNIAAVSASVYSMFNNQAGLADVKDKAVVGGGERRYVWAEVGLYGAGFALPTKSGTFGVGVSGFGIPAYKQQKIGLAYGRQLWQGIRLGGQLDYFRTAISEYGNRGVFSFEIGVQADLTKDLIIGTHIANPYPVEMVEGDNLPTVFQMGLLYKVSEKASFGMELEKDIDFPLRVKAGVAYRPVQKFEIRSGFSSDPSNFHFGLGCFFTKNMVIDMGTQYDLTLGLATSAAVRYLLK